MTGLKAKEVMVSESAANALAGLESRTDAEASSIVRRVRSFRTLLVEDCLHGEVVRKSAIPATLVSRYQVQNLYVEDLPAFWRLLYTILKNRGERFVVVLEIVDHRSYSRWFPGRRR